ncbi:MAG: diguanylate cyclase [Actinobacteria bacterium]|nr:diguanylate cyclase [Actinomycetota bacterium]
MKVLVVDDDPTTAMILSSAVRNLGHEAVVATDGEEAWERYLEVQPGALLTDRMMPGIDGLELCRRIRATGLRGYTYIILITSLGGREQVLEGMEAGADDYLVKPPDPFDLRVRLIAAERVTAVHRRMEELTAELRVANDQLDRLARTDALTEVGNRLRFREDLAALHASSLRHDRRFAVALADIDSFKTYNDRYGHPAGDEALHAVAATMAAVSRYGDAIYRYGGEEIAVLLPETDVAGAVAAGERLREAVRGLALVHDARADGGDILTISVGVACFDPEIHHGPDAVVHAADQALYRAKAAGRDRVSV